MTVEKGNFEIVPWPVQGEIPLWRLAISAIYCCALGWRPLDPETGDEAGTTEGNFDVHWEGDFFYGTNLAVATNNNVYLDGLGAHPDVASRDATSAAKGSIYLWM